MEEASEQVLQDLRKRCTTLETRIYLFHKKIEALSGGKKRVRDKVLRARVDYDICIGCGICVNACPKGAISLEQRPDSEGIGVQEIPRPMPLIFRRDKDGSRVF